MNSLFGSPLHSRVVFGNLPSHGMHSLCRSGMDSEDEVKCGGKIDAATPKQKVKVDSGLDLKGWGWAGACQPCCSSILCVFLLLLVAGLSHRHSRNACPAARQSAHHLISSHLIPGAGIPVETDRFFLWLCWGWKTYSV